MERTKIPITERPAEGEEEVTQPKDGFLAQGATLYSAGGACLASHFTTPLLGLTSPQSRDRRVLRPAILASSGTGAGGDFALIPHHTSHTLTLRDAEHGGICDGHLRERSFMLAGVTAGGDSGGMLLLQPSAGRTTVFATLESPSDR